MTEQEEEAEEVEVEIEEEEAEEAIEEEEAEEEVEEEVDPEEHQRFSFNLIDLLECTLLEVPKMLLSLKIWFLEKVCIMRSV